MGKAPSFGYLLKRSRANNNLANTERMIMACPQCDYDGWKKAALVHDEGHQSAQSSTSGVGFGISTTGIGIGFGSAKTNSTQQNNLSKMAAPPQPTQDNTKILIFLVFVFILSLCCFYESLSPFSFELSGYSLLVAVVSFFLFRAVLRSGRKAEAQYKRSSKEWIHKKMCTRCGHFYN